MGESVSTDRYTPQQRTRYRQLLMEDLEIFDRHLQHSDFEDQGSIGLELELNLVDKHMQPALAGHAVLSHLDDEYQSEIGNFNVEMNHPPLSVKGDALRRLEQGITSRLGRVRAAATSENVNVAMIGTLPTITPEFLEDPAWMTQENRYRALSNAVMESRGELVHINIADREQIIHDFTDLAPESTCTSIQLHLQLAPNKFAAAWNASQAIAGVQAALSANSPLFLGRRVWHESRIPVFQQAIDTRTPELVNQGVRPRVWFGERWITSVFDLFEENVRYFSPLIAESRALSGTPMIIVAMIALSAIVAAWQAIDRMINSRPMENIEWVIAAGVIGFLGNEAVAMYRIRVGKRIGSAALVADGVHARTDGFTSLAVVAGGVGVFLGFPLADPIIGLIISAMIATLLVGTIRSVGRRLMDGIEPELVDKATHAIWHVKEIESIDRLRLRWVGHRLHGDATVSTSTSSLSEATAIALEAELSVKQHLPNVDEMTVTITPSKP